MLLKFHINPKKHMDVINNKHNKMESLNISTLFQSYIYPTKKYLITNNKKHNLITSKNK